jgi:hypothetical protein
MLQLLLSSRVDDLHEKYVELRKILGEMYPFEQLKMEQMMAFRSEVSELNSKITRAPEHKVMGVRKRSILVGCRKAATDYLMNADPGELDVMVALWFPNIEALSARRKAKYILNDFCSSCGGAKDYFALSVIALKYIPNILKFENEIYCCYDRRYKFIINN